MSDPIQPWPVVAQGAQGHPVLTLQELARAHGHAIAVDGVFGPATAGAVRAVQTAAGLSADGIVGPLTWPALIVVVRTGSTGDAVRGVQVEFDFRDLSGEPDAGLAIDGIFGPKTDAKVRGFQGALGLAVDGIVGPLTWRALVSGMLSF
jgi:peptidoglycan hydrolase-like protein with peptidoglycan-binding domain